MPTFAMATQAEEIEVILYSDFYFKVLKELGLKKLLTDLPVEHERLDRYLNEVGALALV